MYISLMVGRLHSRNRDGLTPSLSKLSDLRPS